MSTDSSPPTEPARSIAAQLYAGVRDLPIISPHGHTDPRWFAENKPFANATALLLQPDHYIFRMLYSQGVSLESLGIPQQGSAGDPQAHEAVDPRTAWRIFAKHYYLFRGTPTRLWLDHTFETLFNLTERLSEANADLYYDTIDAALKTAAFLPRALFDRFRIEVLATTDAAVDTLTAHQQIRDSGWPGRVLPTFRPDAVIDAESPGFSENLQQLGQATGEDISTWNGLPERPALSPRLLQIHGRHRHGSRPHHRPHRRPFNSRCSPPLHSPRQRQARKDRRHPALPGADAHRDGRHERRRRPRHATAPRQRSQS